MSVAGLGFGGIMLPIFILRCSVTEKKYSIDCAESVIKSLNLPIENIKNCIGDLEVDTENQVLKAIWAGFNKTLDPPICLNTGVERNECLENNGGCWMDTKGNVTACKVCRNTELITSHLTTIFSISINHRLCLSLLLDLC